MKIAVVGAGAGSTACGAIKGAIAHAELGNLTGLLAKPRHHAHRASNSDPVLALYGLRAWQSAK